MFPFQIDDPEADDDRAIVESAQATDSGVDSQVDAEMDAVESVYNASESLFDATQSLDATQSSVVFGSMYVSHGRRAGFSEEAIQRLVELFPLNSVKFPTLKQIRHVLCTEEDVSLLDSYAPKQISDKLRQLARKDKKIE